MTINLDGQDITVNAELTVGTMDLQAKAYKMEMTCIMASLGVCDGLSANKVQDMLAKH